MAKPVTLNSCGGLEQFLQLSQAQKWKKYHNNRTCFEAYCELKNNLVPIQKDVNIGAMKEEIDGLIASYSKEAEEIFKSNEDVENKIQELLTKHQVIFLNDHGPGHIEKVIERANEILISFVREPLSEFEAFILLCAIQIHDIGNILGRAGHEKKLKNIFDDNCQNIILDSPERRVIKSIAMAHGGELNGSKNTISNLSVTEMIFDNPVRTRLLAAVLRFADELADDSTRASRVAQDLGIIGESSLIFHAYSRSLHTVKIVNDEMNNDFKINLIYELQDKDFKNKYKFDKFEKYLLDEIYDRTIKMERERRYCMKFIHQYINIGRIEVKINIYDEETNLKIDSITYTLEDISYPNEPKVGSIINIASVPTGDEVQKKILGRQIA